MEVMSKSIYKDGVLYKVVDKKGIRILSEPSLGKKIQEGKVANATVVNKKGSRPFVRLAPGTMNHNFDTLPIPEFTDSADRKEANIAKKWALAKKGVNITSAPTNAPAKQRCVAFRFSGGRVSEVVTIALPEGDVKGAEFALHKTLIEKCGLSKTEASLSASTASVWVVKGNAPKSAYKQISFDPESGFKIQCKAVEAVPTKISPESHHIMPKQTAPSTVKTMTKEEHAKQAHGLTKKQSKKGYAGWQPTSVTFDEDGDVVVAKDDCIKVSLVNLDEGINGDYDPDDPDDVNLLRFDVYCRNPEEGLNDWEPVDDASYCTNVEANSTKEHLEKVVRALFKRYRDEYRNIVTGGSVKKMGEELSHIS